MGVVRGTLDVLGPLVRLANRLRRWLFAAFLLLSLTLNAGLLFSGALYQLASGAVAAATGARTLLVRQTDAAAKVSAELAAQRRITRELRSETSEAARQLARQAALVRTLRTDLARTTADLEASRAQMQRIKRQARTIATGVTRRGAQGARRAIATMPAQAIPLWGTAIIVGATTIEIADTCATLTDISDLQRLLDPAFAPSQEQLTVCSLRVPTRSEIWTEARSAPRRAWEASKTAMPAAEDLRALDLPEVDWTGLGAAIAETSASWSDSAARSVGDTWKQIRQWWDN